MHLLTWRRVLVLGFALIVLGAVADLLPLVRAAVACTLIVAGWTRLRGVDPRAGRPWRLIVAGGAVALLSAAVRLVHSAIDGVDYAYPSVADLFAYAAYGFMIAGAVSFVRARTVERYRSDMVDSIVVAFFAAVLLYAFVLGGYLTDASIPLADRIGNGVYSLMTLAIVGSAARVSFGPGVRNVSYYLFAASAFLIVVNDVLLLLDTVGRPGMFAAASIVAPTAFVFGTASLVHPGALQLTDRPAYREERLGTRRIALLLVALGTGPLVSQMEPVRSNPEHVVVVSCLWIVIAFSILYRMVLLVSDREVATGQERSLRDLAAQLTGLQTHEAITAACLRTGLGLIDSSRGARIVVYEQVDDVWRAHAVRGRSAHAVSGITITAAASRDALDTVHATGRSITRELEPSIESPEVPNLDEDVSFVVVVSVPSRQHRALCLAVMSPRLVRREQVAALESLAGQLSLALDGLDLAEQIHQRRSNRRFRALVENSSDVVLVLGDDQRIAFASPTVRRLLGREEDAVIGHDLLEYVHRADQVHIRRILAAPSRTNAGSKSSAEVRLIHGDGELRWFEVEARDLSHDEEVRGIVITASDVSDRKRAESQLLRSEARFRLMVQYSSDVVAIIDEDSLITYVSPSIERMLGFPPADVLGRNVFELLSVNEAERIRQMSEATDTDGSTIEVRVQAADGVVHVCEVGITDLTDQPAVEGVVLNIRDVTDRKVLEDDLHHQALHDDLTGLANRARFTERLDEALRSRGASAELIAVLYVDLDDFKLINDSLGHTAGNEVLVSVAQRIQQCLRLSDVAARLGGDEFTVMLSGVYGDSEILEIVERLRASVSETLTIEGHDLHLTASIGIATDNDSSHSADDLIRAADLAMYKAKQGGKDRHELFAEEMQASAFEELELKSALVRAVENDEFVLHYQPIVDMGTGMIRGVEALVRWEDPTRGMVSPASFIPIAEETGLIRQIGMWVAQQAARDVAQWRRDGHELYVSVNVSGRQMEQNDFVEDFTRAIRGAGAHPSHIVVELTESVLADNGAAELFSELRREGFRIALDDFGTGFSALQYLQNFDIDLIKIDRSFVQALGQTGNTGVVQAVLDMARTVGAATVAEGIEDTAEQRMLKDLGVDLGQGYYFSRPVPAARLVQLLDEERGLIPSEEASGIS